MRARRSWKACPYPGAAGLAAIALAGCASSNRVATPRAPVHTDCLFTRTLDDWTPLDNQHLIIFGPLRREAYLARLFFPTPDLMRDVGITIFDDNGSGNICGGGTDALVFGPRSAVPGRNNIVSLQRIDVARADALVSLAKAREPMATPAPTPAD